MLWVVANALQCSYYGQSLIGYFQKFVQITIQSKSNIQAYE